MRKKRIVQSPDAIPADSEAGRAALAQGGEAAKKVEIPGVATSASPSAEVGRFFETQSSKAGVTLSHYRMAQKLRS